MRKTWSPAGPLRRALTGIATTVVEGPVGPSTRTDAPGAGAWLWIRARTSALRVAGSTRAAAPTILLEIGQGSSAPPGASITWRTVPESSLRRVMELSARMVPTEVVVGRYCRARATARVTDSMGSGWLAAAASAFRAAACFQATRLPAVTRSVPNSTADPTQPRLFMRRRLRIRADLLLSDKGEALLPVLDVGASLNSTSRRSQSRPSFKPRPRYSSVMNKFVCEFPGSPT